MKLLKIILLVVFLSILLPNYALAQEPCDDVIIHLKNKGLIKGTYTELDKGSITLENILFNFIKLTIDGNQSLYYINCESGEIYDHQPTSSELLGPIVSKIDGAVRYWAEKVSKVPVYVGYFTTIEDKLNRLRSAGLEISGTGKYIVHGSATNESIYRIAELDFVGFIGDDKLYQNLTTEYRTPKIVLLANSIDYSLSSDFLDFLKDKGVEMILADASNFEQYKTEKLVVILGGPDAYEGVGAIVRHVLSPDAQNQIRVKGSRGMYVIASAWSEEQVVYVVAGSDRYMTKLAAEENVEIIAQEAKIRS